MVVRLGKLIYNTCGDAVTVIILTVRIIDVEK